MTNLIDDETASRYWQERDTAPEAERESRNAALMEWATAKKAEQRRTQRDEVESGYMDFEGWWGTTGADAAMFNGDEDRQEILNRRYIAHQFDQTPDEQGQYYPTYRDQFLQQTFGKSGLSEGETFNLIKGAVESKKATEGAINNIPGDVAMALWDNIGTGAPVNPAKVLETWKQKNADQLAGLPENWESKTLAEVGKYISDTEQMLRDHAEPLKKVYDHFASVTGRGVENAGESQPKNLEEMQALVDTLAGMPQPVRDRALASVYMAAENSGMDAKGVLQQFGESWSRTLNRVRTTALVAEEYDTTQRLKMLRDTEGLPELYKNKTDQGPKVVTGATAAFSPQDYEPLAPEERAAFAAEAEKELARFQVYRELQNIADNKFDPIQKIKGNATPDFVEAILYGTPDAISTTVVAATPIIGLPLTFGTIYADEYNQLRLQNIDAENAQGIAGYSAGLQMVPEVLGAKLIFGQFPWFEKLVRKYANPARFGRGANFAMRYGAGVVGENITEGLQDLATPVVQDIRAAFRSEVPDVDWDTTWKDWWSSRPDVFAATLVPVMLGTGMASIADSDRFAAYEVRLSEVYKPLGLSEEKIKLIEDGGTPQEMQTRLVEQITSISPEEIKSGIAYQEKRLNEAKAEQEDDTKPTLVRETALDGSQQFVVRDGSGQAVYTSKDYTAASQALIETRREQVAADFNGLQSVIRDLSNQWTSENSVNTLVMEEQGLNAQQKLEQLQAAGNAAQIQELHNRIANSPFKDTPYDQINILGEASVQDVAEMVWKPLITINPNTRPENLREEIHHIGVKIALKNNRVTLDTLRGWLEATESALPGTFQNLVRETEGDIIESLAQVQAAYEDGKINANEETKLPASFIDYIKNMMRAFAEVLRRAVALRGAFKDGILPAEYETFLAESTGLNQQTLVDTTRERVSNEVLTDTVATNFSIGSPAFQNWFSESKAVDPDGKPMVVYHGTQRPDRVGTRFRKSRATSGPMAFFTNDPAIASSYSTNKSDTSAEMPSDYAGWFKWKGKGMRSSVNIDQAWWNLSEAERATIKERIYTVGYSNADEYTGPIVVDSQSIMSRDSIDYELRQARGNAIRALVEMWLSSGSLFNQEEKFLEVLQAAGVKGATLDDPNAARSAVYPVYLSIKNPLDTASIPENVVAALDQASKGKRAKQAKGGNPDAWDKNTISGKDWMAALKEDIANGTTHAWTRIPDWATQTLTSLGYDGIKDTGGKRGGSAHQVWIPFNETQIKSATGNRGTFDPTSPNINYSIGKSTDSVTPIAINFPTPDVPSDIRNLRKYIRQMIADTLQGKSIIVERTGTEVKFTAESKSESVSKARTPIQAAPMLEAEKIVLSGIPVDISEPDSNKKTYKGTRLFRRFAIPVSIGGDVYASHFTVREPSEYAENSGVFYEFNLGKKIESEDMGLPLTNASRLPEDNLPFNSDSTINIEALINKVKGGASNYSISSQSEIDRVNKALGGMNRGPDERLKVYERAREKFSLLQAWNRDELQAMQETGADDTTIRRSQILQGLGELDAILSILPPEVRGRVGGYTKLASIAPHDVFKDGVKVSEVSGMKGALISAWMDQGLNIGQAGKKVDFPPGYTATENLSTKRADKSIADFFRDRIKKIDTELEKVLVREYTEAITKAVKQSRPKAGDNGVRESTLGAETQKFADTVYRATLLDDEATAKRMAEIEAAINAPDATAEDISALSEEWSILNTFGDLDNRSSETLAQGFNWLKGELQMGREAWRIKEQARIDEQRARVAATIEWLGKGTAKKRNTTKTKSELSSDLANHYLLSHASFEQFVTAIFPPEIAARWAEKLRKADEASQTAEIRDRKGILDAVRAGAKAANMSTSEALLWLKADQKNAVAYLEDRKVTDERIAIDLAQKIVTGEADRSKLTDADVETLRNELAALPADTQKEYVTIKRVIFRGNDVKLDMSRGKAMQYLLSWNQPDVQIKMRKEGWTDESAADLQALVNDPVSREVMAYAKELYGKGAGIVNPVYSRMFGMNMPQVKNYAPTRFLNAKDSKDIGLDGSATATGTTPGFAKSRVTHSAKIAPEDALTVMQGHIAQQAHWVHFAELAREFRAILSNPEVRESIKQTQGESVLKDAELWADQIEQRGGNKARESTWMNTILGTVLSGKAISSLGFNLKTLAMQLENTIRFGLALDMKQIVSALSNPSAIVEDIQTVWESNAIQNRLQGGATAEARFLFSRYAGKPNFAAKIAEASMTPINWLDSAGTSISSAIVYRANLNDALAAGMPENLAKQAALNAASEAIYRFAQPVSFGQKSIMENNGNVLAKTFFLFMSDPRLKTAILADAARGLATGRGDASEHIRRIVTVELMAVLSHVISSAFRDAFSDDDDEEIWNLGGFAKAILLAPLQGFFFAGTVGELAISKLTGQKFFSSTQNPLVTSMEQAIRAGTNMEDAINFDDPEAMFKEWNNIFRSMALAPWLAAPAVLLNMVKPVLGLYQNATSDE